MKIYLLLLFALALSSCSTATENIDTNYPQIIERYSDGDVEYSGFHNAFKYKATLMNTEVQSAYINHKKAVYKWDETKTQGELADLQKDNNASTTVFISFFTPRIQDDNLSKKKSVWSIYLETSSGRFEGKVSKYNVSSTETIVMYPYHTGWATSYTAKFPVPIKNIESDISKVTISGPLGSKEVKFPAQSL